MEQTSSPPLAARSAPPPRVTSGLELDRSRSSPNMLRARPITREILRPVDTQRPRPVTRARQIEAEADASTTGALCGLAMLALISEPFLTVALRIERPIPLVGGIIGSVALFALYFATGQFFRRGVLGIVLFTLTWVLAIAAANATTAPGLQLLAAAWILSPLAFGAGVLAQLFSSKLPFIFSWRGVLASAVFSVAGVLAFAA